MELPLATVERIMRKAGADRLTENAIISMRESAGAIADEVADEAVENARQRGNGAVAMEDLEKALEP